jgi:hypothetical protein
MRNKSGTGVDQKGLGGSEAGGGVRVLVLRGRIEAFQRGRKGREGQQSGCGRRVKRDRSW